MPETETTTRQLQFVRRVDSNNAWKIVEEILVIVFFFLSFFSVVVIVNFLIIVVVVVVVVDSCWPLLSLCVISS